MYTQNLNAGRKGWGLKMMNKKMYMTILNYDKNMSPTVKKGFEQLIHEHFDNPPLKFEDLKEGVKDV